MQTQRAILWVVFSMSLFMLWDAWQQHRGAPSMFGPGKPQTEQVQGVTGKPNTDDGLPSPASVPQNTSALPPAGSSSTSAASPLPEKKPASNGIAAKSTVVSNDVLSLSISNVGGIVERAELLKHRAFEGQGKLVLMSRDDTQVYVAQSGFINAPEGQTFPNHHSEFTVESSDDGRLTMVSEGGGLKVERTISLEPGSYLVNVKETVSNTSSDRLAPISYRQLTRDSHQPGGDTGFYSTFVGPVIYTEERKFQKIQFDEIADGSVDHARRAKDGWVGIIQHYFVTAWVPETDIDREYYTQAVDRGRLFSVGMKLPLAELAAGESASTEAKLYLGPQDQQVLEKIAPGLDLTVDYGFLTIIAQPLWWLLDKLHSIFGNWGWAIVVMTIIVKTIFFPLQAASYRSMARMKAVAPRLAALKERYGDDRAKLNQAMMELYKTEKINPLGGCLPVVVQIPVFISFYWVLLASVEMRDAPWIGWIHDLSTPDPFYVLPLLMAISMFVQVKLNPKPPDPMQAKVMMMMPLVFSVMFFFFPSGLVLYWLVNNLYSIAQQWVITRKIMGAK